MPFLTTLGGGSVRGHGRGLGGGGFSLVAHTFTNGGFDSYLPATLSQFRTAYVETTWAANPDYFNVVEGAQFVYVPTSGTYQFRVAGAGGGSDYVGDNGGQGAILQGTVSLTAGQILRIVVGTRGGRYQYTAGGGGASSIAIVDSMTALSFSGLPLIMAGGGGGGGNSGGTGANASYNNNGTSGPPGYAGGSGGSGGSPGPGSSAGGWGTSGAGWSGDGGGADSPGVRNGWNTATPGRRQNGQNSNLRGATPTISSDTHDNPSSGSCVGAPGGFGGGGGGQCNGGGGGAGYSGGGSGGGGGGSYFAASVSSQSNYGYNPANTNGYVILTKL